MLETERSSDEALREPTYRRLYLGAFEIDDYERRLKACFIILLAGRMGLRTGELQHVREEWIDWQRGEIAIPQHDPCGCMNCWIRAKQKATDDEEDLRQEIVDLVEEQMSSDAGRDVDEVVDELLRDDEELPEEIEDDDDDEDDSDDRTAEEILYEERWQPKYPRSARRVPFGHSRRLTAVIIEFIDEIGHLEITQVTMNNLVTEAAENAEGVNPENITIRGLRATAATHYATYIRNPKALQDLLGWTRIETAARYLRRAGAFTTDVVYHSFDKGGMAPAMYPEEPEERYPLIGNPLPYQNEPYDPMPYVKDVRQEFGRDRSQFPHRLIHPRSSNYPEGIEYNSENHEILTHEDYEPEISYRDSLAEFEAPTLAEQLESHDRITELEPDSDSSKRQFESEEEWEEKSTRQSDLSELVQEEDEHRSPARSIVPASLLAFFDNVDQADERITDAINDRSGRSRFMPESQPGRTVFSLLGLGLIGLMVVVILVQSGVLDIETMSLQASPLLFVALGVALLTAYKLPELDSITELFK